MTGRGRSVGENPQSLESVASTKWLVALLMLIASPFLVVGCRKPEGKASSERTVVPQPKTSGTALPQTQIPAAGFPSQTQPYPTNVYPQTQILATDVVYITQAGKKFHRAGCRYLRQGASPIKRTDAIAWGYSACSVCRP